MWDNIKWFFRRVKRTLEFLPHIWKGYDFDYWYSIELFIYQLKRTSKFLKSDRAISLSAKVNARKIDIAVALLKKVYDDEYAVEYIEQLEELYGRNVLDWSFKESKEPGFSELSWEYEKWDNKEEIEKKKKELFLKSQEKQKRAEELVWKYIAHNIRKWWD